MRSHSARVRHGLAALASLSIPTIVLAAAPADPWARVPAPPTGCYFEQDTYQANSDAAFRSLEEEIGKLGQDDAQAEDSGEAEDDAGSGDDSGAMDQAAAFKMMETLQHRMATDPSAAQAIAQAGDPEAARQEGETYKQLAAEQEALRHELDTLNGRYDAATAQAMAPAEAKFNALVKKVESQGGSFSDGEGFNVPDWAMAEWNAILQEKNRIYAGTLCPQWFGPGGQYAAWLKRYKDYYVQKELPAKAKYQARNAELFGLAGRTVKDDMPKATLEAVKDYVDQAGRVYGRRQRAPFSL